MILVFSLIGASLAGFFLTWIQVFLIWRFLSCSNLASADCRDYYSAVDGSDVDVIRPQVSILKPLSGIVDGLEENLESFARLRGISYEVIFSVADPSDPALAVVETVRRRFPAAPFFVVIGGILPRAVKNRKVERLMATACVARGDLLFISDDNVRARPLDIARTIALFDDPTVGGVANLFIVDGADSFGAVMESLHLLTFVLPGTVLAATAGITCVVGKSMGIKRQVLAQVGGFEAFINFLAEDQAMALAIERAGYRVAISPTVVRNVVTNRTLLGALGRQVRWNKIRFAFSKTTYASEFFVNPFPLALVAWVAAAFFAPQAFLSASLFFGVAVLARLLQTAALATIIQGEISWFQILLAPIQDLLQFLAQFAPYLSNEINWRNHKARIGPATRLLPLQADSAQLLEREAKIARAGVETEKRGTGREAAATARQAV